MSRQTLNLTEAVYHYLLSVTLQEDEVLQQCRAETASHAHAGMQIAPEQGQFLALLIKLIGATNVLELGTFTGYSSLCMARALPAGGKILCCDVNEEYTRIAKRYWAAAAVTGKIELRLAPALDTLQSLMQQGRQNSFDFIFIDAVKQEYLAYYRIAYELLRPGGLVAVDNALWDGRVAAEDQTEETVAIRELNTFIHQDVRVDSCLLPVGDGLHLARKT